MSSERARILPARWAVSGMTFSASPELNLPTVITAASVGLILRATMDWMLLTNWAPATMGSLPSSGRAPCAPLPVISRSNRSADAYPSPRKIPTLPAGRSGDIWPAMTRSTRGFSKTSRSIMALAPAPRSSAGWNKNLTLPFNALCRPDSMRVLATPSMMVVLASWPQACITPGFCDL